MLRRLGKQLLTELIIYNGVGRVAPGKDNGSAKKKIFSSLGRPKSSGVYALERDLYNAQYAFSLPPLDLQVTSVSRLPSIGLPNYHKFGQTFFDLHTRLHLFYLISHAIKPARCNLCIL